MNVIKWPLLIKRIDNIKVYICFQFLPVLKRKQKENMKFQNSDTAFENLWKFFFLLNLDYSFYNI